MSSAGALAVCWSGAGPTLLGICAGAETSGVEAAATVALADANIPGDVLVLHPDMHGLVLDRDGTGPTLDLEAFGSRA
jgi:homoserine kinase